ncbi:unnamed protein product [Cyclocybe aegerita]|uniref:MYND-type domain-containing protein n=1 Tax=Cyclocybe aegerita TaxID=1973307 RepID=A0A8S0VUN9_CYCAE|nr:unnamed protein product [Cyclocybe aegerita]
MSNPSSNRKVFQGEATRLCSYCFRRETVHERLQKCAKCLSVGYCGRECQKKDWAHHKSLCFPPEPQRIYIRRMMVEIPKEKILLRYLMIAISIELFKNSPTFPDPRSPCIVSVEVILHPLSHKHYNSLIYPEILFDSVTSISMPGTVRFMSIELENVADHEKLRRSWEDNRQSMDRNPRHLDSLSALIRMNYTAHSNMLAYINMPLTPSDFNSAREVVLRGEPSGTVWGLTSGNPMLDRMNLELSKMKMKSHPLAVDDKRLLRDFGGLCCGNK